MQLINLQVSIVNKLKQLYGTNKLDYQKLNINEFVEQEVRRQKQEVYMLFEGD